MSISLATILETSSRLVTAWRRAPARIQAADFDVFVTKLDIVADLTLALSASPSPVHSGANLTYTITVTNKGPDFATNVLVTDSVPGGATFVSVDSAEPLAVSPR